MQRNTIQSITFEDSALIQASVARVEPIADLAAALLYGRLFELEPAARQPVAGDMHAQQREMMLIGRERRMSSHSLRTKRS